ncbi:hypothetical protein N7495_005479 [Penicillium taxi]|uniref:uncharacterized protein n=1 Tax=Penicillium taxi TaxID=168475 RepID=UPI0025452B42|nr:uncharacterized protein N7495_005479 [Penicillium taxi]KAJ5893788.1 hypothetical protein N7495_005479 [Penicillium taxi]
MGSKVVGKGSNILHGEIAQTGKAACNGILQEMKKSHVIKVSELWRDENVHPVDTGSTIGDVS